MSNIESNAMNRTLKIVLIVAACGLLLIVLAGVVMFRFVREHKDEWLAKGRDTFQEGVAAGAALDDQGCLNRAFEQYRQGDAGIGGIGARLWLKGCLRTATPTAQFCRDVPAQEDIADSIAWQVARCAPYGQIGQSACSGLLNEVQTHCRQRRSAR